MPDITAEQVHTKQADPRLYIRSVTPEGEIEGYVCIFGDPQHRDSYGTFFDKNKMPDMALDYLPQPMYYEHGLDESLGKMRIGKVVQAWADNIGIKFRGFLDKSIEYFDQIVDQINQGLLATSSGTAGHLAEFDDQGRFVSWPLVDLSLTSSPSESRMPMVSLVRSEDGRMFAEFQQSVSIDNTDPTEDASIDGGSAVSERKGEDVATIVIESQPKQRSKRSMLTVEQLGVVPGDGIDAVFAKLADAIGPDAAKAFMASQLGGAPAPMDDPEDQAEAPEMLSVDAGRSKKPATKPAENADITAMRAELDAMRKKIEAEPPAGQTTVRAGTAKVSNVIDMRYDHLSAAEMAFGYNILMAERDPKGVYAKQGVSVVKEEYNRALALKVEAEVLKNTAPVLESSFRSKWHYTRANEVMGSTITGGGLEWIGVYYENAIWEKIRQATIWESLVSAGMTVREIPRGYASDTIPLESTGATWYSVGATTGVDSTLNPAVAVTSSRYTTANKSLTVTKVGVATFFTGELDEDSIIPPLPEIQRQLLLDSQEKIEYLLINGDTDTTASTNINLIDGTPTTGTNGSLYLALNGFLKLALVTTTANSRDGGALATDDYLALLKLMGTNGVNATDPNKILWLVDNPTYFATLALNDVKTREVGLFTLENGTIQQLWGSKLLRSGQMALANGSGKIPAAGGTLGRILAVRPDQWALGWKRHVSTEIERRALSDTTTIVSYMRIGLTARDGEASAVSYNLSV